MSSVSGPGATPPPSQNENVQQALGSFSTGGSGGWGQFKSYLGPAGFKKFQATLMNMIRAQIKQESAKAKKAANNLKLTEEGKTPNP